MSRVRNRASEVGKTLFIRHLVVMRLVQFVIVIPGKSCLSPPTMTQIWWVSVFMDKCWRLGEST